MIPVFVPCAACAHGAQAALPAPFTPAWTLQRASTRVARLSHERVNGPIASIAPGIIAYQCRGLGAHPAFIEFAQAGTHVPILPAVPCAGAWAIRIHGQVSPTHASQSAAGRVDPQRSACGGRRVSLKVSSRLPGTVCGARTLYTVV